MDQTPCVFQGRIAGAKGMWMVDALDESLEGKDERGFWVEITDSQLKFEGHQIDHYDPDKERVTFEVHSYSKKLSPTCLNFQLIPILVNRGVPDSVFSSLVDADLRDKVGRMDEAMETGLSLRRWNQEENSILSERSGAGGIEMLGGLPTSTPEKINWFVEHGFDPKDTLFLKNLLFSAIKDYCLKLENRLNISIGKSTSAFMIADPLAILEEGEIHLGFSSTFRDPRSHWEEVMLHDIDVLVARLPAVLPSDIQKVRAVFRPELRVYRDVIIFSSKGHCALAEKLSGGDYDGDRAWICWEPRLVEPFENFPVPSCPSLESYGIEKDNTKVGDILGHPDYTSEFLRHAFRFNLQSNLLGSCTIYHESLCYGRTSIDDPKAMAIAWLLGLLVDRAKAGIKFDNTIWLDFLRENGLPTHLEKPAYKNKEKATPTEHMIDRLVFHDAKVVREETLRKFSENFADVGSYDMDLVRIYKSELDMAKEDEFLGSVLKELKKAIESIAAFWSQSTTRLKKEDEEFNTPRRQAIGLSFPALVQKCRADFVAIAPAYGPEEPHKSHIIRRWERESGDSAPGRYWPLLKASALFYHFHARGMVWHVAGVELGEIKATSKGPGTYRVVVNMVHQAMKLDRKMVDKVLRMELARDATGKDAEEDDEFGEWFED